jgi:DNA primase
MKADVTWRRKAAETTPELLFVNEDRRAIAERLITFCNQEGEVDSALLAEGLNEDQKCLLSGIIIKDDQALAEDSAQIFDDCLKAVEKERLKIRYRQLQELIRQADAVDDREQRSTWQRESLDVLMKIKKTR